MTRGGILLDHGIPPESELADSSPPVVADPRELTYSEDELLALPDVRSVIQGLATVGSYTLIYGASGSGKSPVLQHLCACLDRGQKWHGMHVHPSCVLYVAGEGQQGQQNRHKAWKKTHPEMGGLAHTDWLLKPLCLTPGDEWSQDRTAADWALLRQAIARLKERTGREHCVVALDTYASVTPGRNENDSGEWQMFKDRMVEISAELNVSWFLTHHVPKNGSATPRGTGAMKDSADLVIFVSKDTANGQRNITLSTGDGVSGKVKDGDDSWECQGRLVVQEVGIDEWNEPKTSVAYREATSDERAQAENERASAQVAAGEAKAKTLAQGMVSMTDDGDDNTSGLFTWQAIKDSLLDANDPSAPTDRTLRDGRKWMTERDYMKRVGAGKTTTWSLTNPGLEWVKSTPGGG